MKKKTSKICMIVFSNYPADPRVRREAEVLERAGLEVDVICLRKPGESRVQRLGGIRAFRVMGVSGRNESLVKYFLLSAVFGIGAFLKLLALSVRNRYGLVQVHNMPDFLVFTGLFHKIAGVPVVLDLHDLTVELFQSKTEGNTLGRLLPVVKAVEKMSCAFADQLITTSYGFRDKLMERGVPEEKITLVFNSADDKIFRTGLARKISKKTHEGPVLLYHGTVARRFGLHIAIEAVGKLKGRLPGTKLLINGKFDPSYKAELETLIKKNRLEAHVSLGGFLELEKVTEVINSSDIGVVPYLSDSFMNLALSTKIFEYVSMRMPVVASALDSIRSIFSEDSIAFFRPGDPDDLADRIEELYNRPEQAERNAESAIRAYEGISWPVMSKRYLNTVNRLVAG